MRLRLIGLLLEVDAVRGRPRDRLATGLHLAWHGLEAARVRDETRHAHLVRPVRLHLKISIARLATRFQPGERLIALPAAPRELHRHAAHPLPTHVEYPHLDNAVQVRI